MSDLVVRAAERAAERAAGSGILAAEVMRRRVELARHGRLDRRALDVLYLLGDADAAALLVKEPGDSLVLDGNLLTARRSLAKFVMRVGQWGTVFLGVELVRATANREWCRSSVRKSVNAASSALERWLETPRPDDVESEVRDLLKEAQDEVSQSGMSRNHYLVWLFEDVLRCAVYPNFEVWGQNAIDKSRALLGAQTTLDVMTRAAWTWAEGGRAS